MRARRVFAVFALLLAVFAADSEAAKKKKAPRRNPTKPAQQQAQKAPQADKRAVLELMGSFKWGMSTEEVYEVLFKQIDERYAEKIKQTTDIYTQNQLRKKAEAEKKKIKSSFIRFNGQETSWDVSIVDREFWHKNDESMFVVWEVDPASGRDQRRFYFFVDDKLWKMFIAFNSEMFAGKTFEDFKQAMETRYGKGAIHTRQNSDGTEEVDYLFWRSGDVFLRAIDQTKFYSSFCLSLSDDNLERTLQARRNERNPKPTGDSNIIDSVTDKNPGGQQKPPDTNSDVVDRITSGR